MNYYIWLLVCVALFCVGMVLFVSQDDIHEWLSNVGIGMGILSVFALLALCQMNDYLPREGEIIEETATFEIMEVSPADNGIAVLYKGENGKYQTTVTERIEKTDGETRLSLTKIEFCGLVKEYYVYYLNEDER